MEFGVCGQPDIASVLGEVGYDFVEVHVQRDLKTDGTAEEFQPLLDQLRVAAVPVTAANCFVPGDLKITGPNVDMDALTRYVQTAFDRASQAGIDTIVFGSGGARRIPDGFGRDVAWQQLLDFGQMIAPVAQSFDITVVVEPLNRRECNVFNSVGECAKYVRQINHPHVRLLVDAYHWAQENDSYQDLVESLPLIRHAHIATYESRMAPSLEACDFGPFFAALKQGGYSGRISIEGKWNDLESDAAAALQELKRAASEAGL